VISRASPAKIERRIEVRRGEAMASLRRYELNECADQPFETLSGGQQARLQILLLEISGAWTEFKGPKAS